MEQDSISERANEATRAFLEEMRAIAEDAQRADKDEVQLENERLHRLNARLRKRLDAERLKNRRIVATLPENHPGRRLAERG